MKHVSVFLPVLAILLVFVKSRDAFAEVYCSAQDFNWQPHESIYFLKAREETNTTECYVSVNSNSVSIDLKKYLILDKCTHNIFMPG